jgi:hypothetical protein
MATITVPQAGAFQILDTGATANTGALRDSLGGIAAVQVLGSELKSSGIVTLARVAKTASFTADANGFFYSCDATSGAIVATLPPAASVSGRVYSFKKTDVSGNAVTVTGNAAETIDGSNTKALSSQYAKTLILSNGTSWEILV